MNGNWTQQGPQFQKTLMINKFNTFYVLVTVQRKFLYNKTN